MHRRCHIHIQVVLSQLCLLFFEMFVLRPVIAPLFHDFECGPVLLIIKLWCVNPRTRTLALITKSEGWPLFSNCSVLVGAAGTARVYL